MHTSQFAHSAFSSQGGRFCAALESRPLSADTEMCCGRDHLADIRWKYENCHRPYKLVHHVANLIQELERAGVRRACETSLPPVDTCIWQFVHPHPPQAACI